METETHIHIYRYDASTDEYVAMAEQITALMSAARMDGTVNVETGYTDPYTEGWSGCLKDGVRTQTELMERVNAIIDSEIKAWDSAANNALTEHHDGQGFLRLTARAGTLKRLKDILAEQL